MIYPLRVIDGRLEGSSAAVILVLSGVAMLLVEGIDYVTGYEVSLSLLYLGPIAVAAWYGGRWPGFVLAGVSCLAWYIADQAAGNDYSTAAIPVWNALVRLGFFVVTARLLIALKESLATQKRLARIDALTGLQRRHAFEEGFRHDLALAQRRRSPLTVVYLDVDDFKSVNDERGHAAGDAVLSTIGDALRRSMREADTAARLGGDEFALLLPETDAPGARSAVFGLMETIERSLEREGWTVTCSVGVVTFVEPAASVEEAMASADELMYKVKRGGKGTVRFRIVDEPGARPALMRGRAENVENVRLGTPRHPTA